MSLNKPATTKLPLISFLAFSTPYCRCLKNYQDNITKKPTLLLQKKLCNFIFSNQDQQKRQDYQSSQHHFLSD